MAFLAKGDLAHLHALRTPRALGGQGDSGSGSTCGCREVMAGSHPGGQAMESRPRARQAMVVTTLIRDAWRPYAW